MGCAQSGEKKPSAKPLNNPEKGDPQNPNSSGAKPQAQPNKPPAVNTITRKQ